MVPIGYWSARFAEGARCTIFTERGSYRGTILPLMASGHTYGDDVDEQPTGWSYVEIRVDARCSTAAEAIRLGIDVGDVVSIDPAYADGLNLASIVQRDLDILIPGVIAAAVFVATVFVGADAMSRATG